MSSKVSPRIVSCPTCGQRAVFEASNPFRPFCSERCKLIDLGEWVAGRRFIPGEDIASAVPKTPPEEEPAE